MRSLLVGALVFGMGMSATAETWVPAGKTVFSVAQSSQDNVWGVASLKREFSRWKGGQDWFSQGGPYLNQIDVASDGTAWAVSRGYSIFHLQGDQWVPIEGRLHQITVGSAQEVWGTDSRGAVWRREKDSWKQMPGSLIQVEAGSDGDVWGVSRNNQVYRWVKGDWTLMPGTLKEVSVEPGNIWGLGPKGEVFRWEEKEDQSKWVPVEGKLRHIHAGADGSVWGITPTSIPVYLKR